MKLGNLVEGWIAIQVKIWRQIETLLFAKGEVELKLDLTLVIVKLIDLLEKLLMK